MTFTIQPIGTIHTPYKQKFAIPRQPGLVKSAKGKIEFADRFNDPNYLRGLEQFSHLWLLFQFHKNADKGYSPLVRPPRLGGNQKIGVFATRSTFRPNGIGMSVVEFDSVEQTNGKLYLHVKAMDLLDGTPILDIKPYVPYADHIQGASGGFAEHAPNQMKVTFSDEASRTTQTLLGKYPDLNMLITEILAQDPRPAYQNQPNKTYGMSLYDLNIQWQVDDEVAHVIQIETED